MKTVSRLVRRYMLAAFAIVLLVTAVNAALFLGLIIRFGLQQQEAGNVPVSRLAESFAMQKDGTLALQADIDWQAHYDWAMLLDDGGEIIWSQALPQELDHAYTVPEVASFSRWYLKDYPVMVYRNDYGLLVAGLPVGSMTRFSLYMDNGILQAMLSGFVPLLLLDAGLVLLVCLLLGWRGASPLRTLAGGVERLAEGKSVRLEERGATAELAAKLNCTSERLQEQARAIERRDTARTQWIAGVSHDIRTPLALIMGYAEQIEHMAPPGSQQQGRAAAIRAQSQRIKTLIEDLNLTSKLQYNAQPLRLCPVQVGELLRRCVAGFCDGAGSGLDVELSISQETERLALLLDNELMTRAMDNLLNNCARHNPNGCKVFVSARFRSDMLVLTVRDDGAGYPAKVLECLQGGGEARSQDGPHILGLALVRQIAQAHGGCCAFDNDGGALARMTLKIKTAARIAKCTQPEK